MMQGQQDCAQLKNVPACLVIWDDGALGIDAASKADPYAGLHQAVDLALVEAGGQGLRRRKRPSLCGRNGSQLWRQRQGYAGRHGCGSDRHAEERGAIPAAASVVVRACVVGLSRLWTEPWTGLPP